MIKKFTLLLTSLALTASVLAAPVQHRLKGLDKSNYKASAAKSSKALNTRVKFDENIPHSQKLKVRRLPAPIIDEVPEGTVYDYARDCTGWFYFWGYLLQEPIYGFVQKVVEAEDNVVYLNGGVSEFPLVDTWVKGQKDADGNIVIPSGQLVYSESYEGDIYNFGLVALTYEIVYDEEEDEQYIETTAFDELKLTYEDGKYKCLDEGVMWALCEYDEEMDEWMWTGYGDEDLCIYPMDVKPVEVPENLDVLKWTLTSENNGVTFGYFTEVGVDGNDIYIRGLLEDSEYYVKGTIQEDGKSVVIPRGQLVGIDIYNSWNFIFGGVLEMVYDEYYEEDVPSPKVTGDVTLAYDAEKKVLSTEDLIVFCTNAPQDLEQAYPMTYLDGCTIKYQVRNINAEIPAPENVKVVDWWDDYGSFDLDFDLSQFDKEGALLDMNKLFYSVYIDSEIFTFYGDEFYDLPDDGTDEVNSLFTNYDNIFSSDNHVTIYLPMNGFDSVGVQAIYYDTDPETNKPVVIKSAITTFELEGSVNTVAEDVASSTYFDLQGRRVAGSVPGLYIRRDVMKDGSVKAVKVIVK